MYNVTTINFSEDFQTASVVFNDARVIDVPTSELTPHVEEVDSNGGFVTPCPYGMDPSGEVYLDFTEYIDGAIEDPEIIERVLVRAGIDSGLSWTVTGRKAAYQRNNNTYTVKAANHNDLLYLVRNYAEVLLISRNDQQVEELLQAA